VPPDLLADIDLLIRNAWVLGWWSVSVVFTFGFVRREQLVDYLGTPKLNTGYDWRYARTEMSLFARTWQVHKDLLRGCFVLSLLFCLFLFDLLRGALVNVWNYRLLADSKLWGLVVFDFDLLFRYVDMFKFVWKWERALFIQTLRRDLSKNRPLREFWFGHIFLDFTFSNHEARSTRKALLAVEGRFFQFCQWNLRFRWATC